MVKLKEYSPILIASIVVFSSILFSKDFILTINSSREKETIVTTAWYTTQIPVSNGPSTFYGLPGLILEINDGTTTIVCTEIILNPSEKITIEEPEKGKIVNQIDFDKISEEKTKEMMERFSSRQSVDLGNGINIKMSGN